MIDVKLLPSNVLRDLLENHSEEQISQMSADEAFERFLDWNGIINYATMITNAIDSIRKASVASDNQPIITKLGATFQDLYNQIGRMTPDQRECNLAVELILSEETLSSTGSSNQSPDVMLDVAGPNHDTLDDNHPVFVVQY